ncbi:MAG: hypothetical protein PHQ36_12785 [Anaerolineales bacterium]|nr:hypothetical protein [Anaerolineales bacterium]
MKNHARNFLPAILILFLLISCAPKAPTPDINQQINQIVAATLMALPTNPPPPTFTPYPSPTPFDLAGFFCEYQFCIGHPKDISFFDLSAQKNPLAPSSYEMGLLAAVNNSTYIQVIWQRAPGTNDPQFLLDLILINQADTRTGNLDVKLERGMNVVYTALNSTATILPYGGAGAWTCGDRVFAWKTYTQQADTPASMFAEALAKFTCGQN